jgi:hypothetical protein
VHAGPVPAGRRLPAVHPGGGADDGSDEHASAARYQVGGEIIMTYRRNLLARLDNRAFPGAS